MRYRFVDKIVALEPGHSIECQRIWPQELEIFADHFPEFPVVPGVLLTEMMGQAAGLCLSSRTGEHNAAMLIQIKNAIFRDWVKPAELLTIRATILSSRSRLARIEARTERDGVEVASTELLFAFESNDKLGLPATDPLLADFWSRAGAGSGA